MERIFKYLVYGQLRDEFIETFLSNLVQLINDDNLHVVLKTLGILQQYSVQCKKTQTYICLKLVPILFNKFNCKTIPHKCIIDTLVSFKSQIKFSDFFSVLLQYIESKNMVYKINTLLIIEELIEIDKKKKIRKYIKILMQSFIDIIKSTELSVKVVMINLTAKLIYFYSESLVEPILVLLNRREVKRLNSFVEKFEYKFGMREIIKK